MRRKMVPSRDMALEAMRWSMRALVALIESRPEENRWIAQLKRLADRVTAAALEDFEVLILAAEGYLCAGEHESAIRIGRSVLRAEPLNTLAGWVTFQAVLQSGNIDEARELATSLIDQYVLQDGPRHYGFAVRLAYGVKDVGTVIRLGPEALRREPGDLDVLGRLSVALLMSKRPEEAYRYFETMRRLAPDALMTRQLAASFETSG